MRTFTFPDIIAWAKTMTDCEKIMMKECTTVISVSEIIGLASQFATQNYLGYYLKLNLGSKFHAEIASHLPYIKLTLYTLNIIL